MRPAPPGPCSGLPGPQRRGPVPRSGRTRDHHWSAPTTCRHRQDRKGGTGRAGSPSTPRDRSYLDLRDTAREHPVAVPALPVGGDPEVDLASAGDRYGPHPVDVLPPEGRDVGSPRDEPPGSDHPDEEGPPRQFPGDQVDRGISLARPQHRVATPAQVLAGIVLCGPGPAAVNPLVAGLHLIHSHPVQAPGSQGSPDSEGPGMACRPEGCRPSWSISLLSARRSTGTSSVSPSLHPLELGLTGKDLAVSLENQILVEHPAHPIAWCKNLFAIGEKDRLSSLCVTAVEGLDIPGEPAILHILSPHQRW